MDQFSAMRAYRSIVEAGSLSRAAERLQTSHTTLSRTLQALERQLGVRLLNRNSRGLTATEAGAQYYRDCVDILARVEAAAQRMGGEGRLPTGTLRLSVPHAVGALELGQWLPGFLQAQPRLRLDLSCDDRLVDLVQGGFDLAVRIAAALPDSGLIARELAVCERVLVAAPAYVAQHGLPRTPEDLRGHRVLGHAAEGPRLGLRSRQGRTAVLGLCAQLRMDSILALHAATTAGLGIAAFTEPTVREDLATGRLLRVLPDHQAGQRRYYALYPQARQVAPKVRVFTDYLRAHYAGAARSG